MFLYQLKKTIPYLLLTNLIILPYLIQAQKTIDGHSGSAQNAPHRTIDSLLNVLKILSSPTSEIKLVEGSDTTQINTLNLLSWQYINIVNFHLALQYAQLAQAQAEKINFKKGIANAYNNIGRIYHSQGNYEKALDYHAKALKIRVEIGNKKGIANSQNNIGMIYHSQGNYENALDYLFKSLKIREEMGDKPAMAQSYNNIGNIYERQNNYEKAIEWYMKSLGINEKCEDKNGIATSNFNIGNIYFQKKEFPKALNYYFKSLNTLEQIGNVQGISASMGSIGNVYTAQENYLKALEYYKKSLKSQIEMNDKPGAITSYNNIGTLYINENKLKESYHYLNKSLILSKEIGNKEGVKEAYISLCDLYDKKGDFKQAFYYHKLYSDIKDSLLNEQSSKQIAEMNTKYETEKKEKENKILVQENKILAQENDIQKYEINRKNYFIYGLSTSIIFILCLAYLFIRQNKIQAKQKTIELEQKLLRAQMNPHFIFNSLNAIQNYIYKHDSENAGEYLSKFATLMRMVLENSIHENITLEREIIGLTLYLELQALRFDNTFDYSIEADPNIDTEIFFVPPMLAQPFIENSIEHGIFHKKERGRIAVRFLLKDKHLVFEVEDNGVGRQKAAELKQSLNNSHQSLATTITKERLVILNKKARKKIAFTIIDLESNNVVQGTKVVFEIPLVI